MDIRRIKQTINKKKKSRTSWLDKNVFKGWLTPHPTKNRALCIVCNVSIKYSKAHLIRHSWSITHKENVSLVVYPQITVYKEKVNSNEHSQKVPDEEEVYLVEHLQSNTQKEVSSVKHSQLNAQDEEISLVEHPQSNTQEEVSLIEHSQSNIQKEEVSLVEHPQSNTQEKEIVSVEHSQLNTQRKRIILVKHPQFNMYKNKIILIKYPYPTTHIEKTNLVEQSQSIIHTAKANSIEHSQSVIHEKNANLVKSSQSITDKKQANLAEPSRSITYNKQVNLIVNSQSVTHKEKPNLVVHSQLVTPTEKASSQNLSKEKINLFSYENKVKRAETKLSAFFTQHNIPLDALDHFMSIIKDIGKNPEAVAHPSFGQNERTRNTQIVEEGVEVDEMIKNLRTCKFSILIDESSNNFKKVMCVFVQYTSPQDKKITKQILKLINIELTDPVNTFFVEFKKFLEKKKIPLQNIVAVVSDNTSAMSGCSYIMSHLKLEIPKLITLNCIGYSSTTIVNSAYAHIPQSCEHLIQEVVSYISDNTAESARLNEFKDIFNTEIKMILKSSDTKWLVLHKCIVKLTENWDTLKNYFAAVESKSKSAIISKLFNNDSTKAYLLFLKYSLNYFNSLNDFYQSRRFLSHILFEKSQQLIREVALNFMVLNILEDIVNINLSDENNLLNINDVYVGPECQSFLNTLSPKHAREIRIQCRDFYTAAVSKMLECLPYKNTIFEQLMFLQPRIALYYDGRKKITDLTFIATYIEHPDITKLAYEWRILPTIYNDAEKEELAVLQVDEMWKQILKYENFNGHKMFPNLELLIESVFTFPHSNFEIKHILSMVTSIKCEEDDI